MKANFSQAGLIKNPLKDPSDKILLQWFTVPVKDRLYGLFLAQGQAFHFTVIL